MNEPKTTAAKSQSVLIDTMDSDGKRRFTEVLYLSTHALLDEMIRTANQFTSSPVNCSSTTKAYSNSKVLPNDFFHRVSRYVKR